MGYKYASTKEERAAATLLREKGWDVAEPSCPECHGWGFVNVFTTWNGGTGSGSTSVLSQKPCPQGCETPTLYFNSSVAS